MPSRRSDEQAIEVPKFLPAKKQPGIGSPPGETAALIEQLGQLAARYEEIIRQATERLNDIRTFIAEAKENEREATLPEPTKKKVPAWAKRKPGGRRRHPPQKPPEKPQQHSQGRAWALPDARLGALPAEPVVPVEKSVTETGIICLIDGTKRKMLAPYLRTRYGISEQEYRDHFGLPDSYPLSIVGKGVAGRVGVTHRSNQMWRTVRQVLDGIDRQKAVLSALRRLEGERSSREITEDILSRHQRHVADSVLMMEVTSRISVTLANMADSGYIEKCGTGYRRKWKLKDVRFRSHAS